MDDPDIQYLYQSPGSAERKGKDRHQQSRSPPTLTMSPLARDPMHVSNSSVDWGKSMGNMENAKMALETLRSLVQDAVFLDEEAYTNAHTVQVYQSRVQAQARRIHVLEGEVEALRAETERAEQALEAARASVEGANSRVRELQSEVDNNSVVFDMHYKELLLKNDEIARLKAIIEGLGLNTDRSAMG